MANTLFCEVYLTTKSGNPEIPHNQITNNILDGNTIPGDTYQTNYLLNEIVDRNNTIESQFKYSLRS
mgnify:CR=1 FL=1